MNYIGITNWSEHPDVQGIVVSDGRLVRSFCKCGYVDKATIEECPSCGNKNFVKAKKTIREYRLSPCKSTYYDDTLQIDELNSYYDIARTQSHETRILFKTNRTYATAISSCGYDRVKMFFDEPEFKAFAPYVVAKEVYDHYKDANWSEVTRVCLQFYRTNPTAFSVENVLNTLDQMGDKMSQKLRLISNMSINNNPYDIVAKLNKLPDALRQACDNPSVFSDIVYSRYNNIKYLYDDVIYLVHAYWNGGYISAQNEASIFQAISSVGFDAKAIPSFVKFFKEEYTAISKGTCDINAFLSYLKDVPDTTVKDYFIESNKAIVAKAYKIKDVDNALNDVYQNPASFFISLAK